MFAMGRFSAFHIPGEKCITHLDRGLHLKNGSIQMFSGHRPVKNQMAFQHELCWIANTFARMRG